MSSVSVFQVLATAIQARTDLFDTQHESAFRLFNGFTEGYPNIILDVYGQTLVFHNYAAEPMHDQMVVQEVIEKVHNSLLWLRAGILKTRNSKVEAKKKGTLIFGDKPDTRINEHGVWYAIALTMNRDTSFYIDTRHLRKWLLENMHSRSVLNTFAYTGSLGVAALAGGAARVVQHDLNRRFLELTKASYKLNGFPVASRDFIAADFFSTVARFKNTKQMFDCVILDPPFFSATPKGKVDQEKDSARLINKVRPLINDGGYLVAINNALYVSGRDYMQTLEELCRDGYLKIEELISVPEDCAGYHMIGQPITDPNPFNHSTKIAILKVRRKRV